MLYEEDLQNTCVTSVYNGKERWTTPTSLSKSGLIEIPHGLKQFALDFQHVLTDLRQMKEEDFEQYKEHMHCYHILKLQRHSHAGEVLPLFESMIDYLQWCFKTNPELSHTIFTLAFYIEGNYPQKQEKIAHFLKEKINQGEDMPILLEKLIEQGRKEGKIEGKMEGLLLSAQKMLEKGFQAEVIAELLEIPLLDIQALQTKSP